MIGFADFLLIVAISALAAGLVCGAGVLALRLPRDPHHPGRGRPVVGIVLGVIGTGCWAGILGAALSG